MLTVRCKQCGVELTSTHKSQLCGCSNQMEVIGDKISACDLSKVVIIKNEKKSESGSVLKPEDIAWQEQRRKRKVKRMDFEIR
tara:strand:- start:899 stop:1147 length:249 start_codon:yes stop_codon:yes gene_type:complete